MADSYETATFMRNIPASAITPDRRRALKACGFSGHATLNGEVYFVAENGVTDAEKAMEMFRSNGDEAAALELEWTDVVQSILRNLPEDEFPWIDVAAGYGCDKARPGEFGGWAARIYRDAVAWVDTQQGGTFAHPTLHDKNHRRWIEEFVLWRVENGQLDMEDMARKIAAYAAPLEPRYTGTLEEIDRLRDALESYQEDGYETPRLSEYPKPAECEAVLAYLKAQDPGHAMSEASELTPWRVVLYEGPQDRFTVEFDCMAKDADDAAEQAEKAYPGCFFVNHGIKPRHR